MEDKKYGIFIGRFQPLHNAHIKIINKIIADGLVPFIVIGSINEERNLSRNPLSYQQRSQLIKSVFPEISDEHIVGIKDCENQIELWYKNLIKILPAKNKSIIYYCVKQVDKSNFKFNGKIHLDKTYHQIFKEKNWKVVVLAKTDEIDATNLRRDAILCKTNTPKIVFKLLKKWGIY